MSKINVTSSDGKSPLKKADELLKGEELQVALV
jgi:hypothetical protein